MAISTSSITSLLEKELYAVFTDYDHYGNEQWKPIFDSRKSEKSEEILVEMSDLTPATIKPEMAAMELSTIAEANKYRFVHKAIALSFQVSHEAIKDNLYKSDFGMNAERLKSSMQYAKNVLAMKTFNEAFTTTLADGKALCASDHPVDNGSYSNTLSTDADFSATSLTSALIGIQSMKSANGMILDTKPKCLIIPKELQFRAQEVLGSQYDPKTANNTINTMYNVLPDGHIVNQFLTSTDAWFIKTNAQQGLIHFDREGISLSSESNDDTKSMKFGAFERYSFGVANPRSVFGSAGTGI